MEPILQPTVTSRQTIFSLFAALVVAVGMTFGTGGLKQRIEAKAARRAQSRSWLSLIGEV